MTLPVRLTRTSVAAAAAALGLAGCVSSQTPDTPFKPGPAVTLRLAVYGNPGYQRTGLLRGYLAVPRASAHQQDAYQLALYLTGPQAGPVLTQAGVFPARTPAITAAVNVTNPYFSDARGRWAPGARSERIS